MVVPAGTTTGVETCAGSLSRIFQPETFTGEAERFLSSTQSATWSPLDSTSLMTTSGGPDGSPPSHALTEPRVSVTTPKAPVTSKTTYACAARLVPAGTVKAWVSSLSLST